MSVSIEIKNLTKKFGNNHILKNVSFIENGAKPLVFLGANGSGKSTLIKILCGYLYYNSGKIIWNNDEDLMPDFAISAPYIDLFEHLTLEEHLSQHFNFKKRLNNFSNIEILEQSNLLVHKAKFIKQLSSGLKQRFKNIQAIFSDTQVLFLDEPCSNLDEQNIKLYRELLQKFSATKTIIIASNNTCEYDFLCTVKYKIENGSLKKSE
ncbi:MAG: ATP-binding cassette domain-containing protein [Bacteroidetes bacterium]|nr:ATP-binding cassette domain-containing protein [Bacteroidota bacterium]